MLIGKTEAHQGLQGFYILRVLMVLIEDNESAFVVAIDGIKGLYISNILAFY